MDQSVVMAVSMALRVYEQVVLFLANRGIRVAELERMRAENGGKFTVEQLDTLERRAFSAIDRIPE